MPLDPDTRALLRAWRRRPAPREPWRFRLALGVVLVLHALFAVVAWREMQPRPGRELVRVRLDDALQVRFIERPRETAPSPAPSLPPPAAPPRPARGAPGEGTVTGAGSGTGRRPAADAPSPRAPPRLYDRTGQPLLPAIAASAGSTPGYVQRLPQGDARVMRHDSPIRYRATRFDDDFPPPGETIVGQAVRRALDATHTGEHKQVDLGRGVHLKCKTLFGIPTPMCGMPPAPPSRKDGDERLNMAPAPLARELAPPRRTLSECIALYRAGKPLPHGCPVDTPGRAVDAECGEARQAGKPLPPHCGKP